MLKLIFTVLCLIVAVQSYCVQYNGVATGYMDVCDINIKNCRTYGSYKTNCVNLNSGVYYTGNSRSSSYFCLIYSQSNCGGGNYAIKSLTKFPFRAYSMRCPFTCSWVDGWLSLIYKVCNLILITCCNL